MGGDVRYFDLKQRVPEAGAVDPKLLTWLYGVVVRMPVVRSAYRRFVAGILRQEVHEGYALDLGTGPGLIAVEVARMRPRLRIMGVDLAAHMVQQASRSAARARLDGRGLWPQADGHRLPFADASFQLVFSSFALHHWQDPLAVLNEIARVLAPGGRYYIADLCREATGVQRLFAYASILAISLPFGSYLGYGGYYESVRAGYTRAEAQALLERSSLPRGRLELASTTLLPIWVMASTVDGRGVSRASEDGESA